MGNKVVIVTGASSGIGYATAMEFVRNGANVVAVGRNQSELQKLCEESVGSEGSIKEQLVDLRVHSQIDQLFESVIEEFGRLDVLVNAAGIIGTGSIMDTKLDAWDKMLEINLRSVFYLMQKSIKYLEKTKGNVVNVSSVTGTRAFPNILAYGVSKAGVDQLTRIAALELAPKGIRVNAVNPGVVVTNLHKRSGMSDKDYAAFLDHSKETHPIGRAGEAGEIADLIYYLASNKAAWITGATYEIDGGRAQTCAR